MYDRFQNFQFVISLCSLWLQPMGNLEAPVQIMLSCNCFVECYDGIVVNLKSDVASLHVFCKTFPS
jgi:hypothetical protein